MRNRDSSPTLKNCTFFGNTAKTNGGGMRSFGTSSPILENCTLINNTADSDNDGSGSGGGVYVDISNVSTLTVRNTIVANNKKGTSVDDDFWHDEVGTVSSEYNIVEFSAGYTAGTGDITGDQPLLSIEDLDNNGGLPQTCALLAGSPAINAADPATVLAQDQRGEPNIGTKDIGAYEYQGPAVTTTNADTVSTSDATVVGNIPITHALMQSIQTG